jgi:ABC-type transporter Mla maintaining outer membrane lipid asymmetry ATPase subunit MlaF
MTPPIRFDKLVLNVAGERSGSAPFSWELPATGVYAVAVAGGESGVLVRTCIGLTTPAAGQVHVLGVEPYRLARRARLRLNRQIAPWLLPPALLSNASVRAGILLLLMHNPAWTRRSAAERVDHVLRICGVAGFADVRPADLSGRIRTRAALARALAPAPRVLIADDFAARLDRRERMELVELCRSEVPVTLIATAVPERLADVVAETVWMSGDLRMEHA